MTIFHLRHSYTKQFFSAPFIRGYSTDKRPSFFGIFIQNLKTEYTQDKKIQENLNKFRDEARKLEESEALKDARKKFERIENETAKLRIPEQLSDFADKLKDEVGKLQGSGRIAEFAKKAGKSAAETIEKSEVFKTASSTASVIKNEIEGQTLGGKVYVKPSKLRMRKNTECNNENPILINTDAINVELHKDSRFYASWESFKENNSVYNKFVEAKMKYEESHNPIVLGSRFVTDKISEIFGSLFSSTELSKTLTEIVKMDPNFCREQFLKDCENDIIPNILEAINSGDLKILQDWCFEAPFNILATPIRQVQTLGYTLHSQILDIDNVDLTTGMMVEQGPVLAITFNVQQVLCIKDRNGVVIEGNPDQVLRIMYIFVLCRDQSELDPKAAWKLMEFQARDRQEQYL